MQGARSTSVRGTGRITKARIGAKLAAEKAAATTAEAEVTPTPAVDIEGERIAAQNQARLAAIASTRTGRIARAVASTAHAVFHPFLTIKSAAAKTKAFFAEVRENRAARRDFKAWLKREDNRDVATFYKGARADNHVIANRVAYGLNMLGLGLNVGLMNVAAGMGLAPLAVLHGTFASLNNVAGLLAAEAAHKGVRKANNNTIEFALGNQGRFIAQSRLERWAKAGIIDAELTIKPAEAGAE